MVDWLFVGVLWSSAGNSMLSECFHLVSHNLYNCEFEHYNIVHAFNNFKNRQILGFIILFFYNVHVPEFLYHLMHSVLIPYSSSYPHCRQTL